MRTNIGLRVLLLAHGHIGNNVFCTPAIRFLHRNYPNTLFDVVSLNNASSDVFSYSQDINELFVVRRGWVLRRLAKSYDTVICLNPKSRYLLDGFDGRVLDVTSPAPNIHSADNILNQVAILTNCELDGEDRRYHVYFDRSREDSVLSHDLVDNGDILVGLHLGCARTAKHGWKSLFKQKVTHRKLWPIESYISLGKILSAENPKIRFFITGTRNETFMGKCFQKQVGRTINLIGSTSLSDVVKAIDLSRLFVTHDCGILHVASSCNTPLIALFGTNNPLQVGPYPMREDRTVIKRDTMFDICPEEVASLALDVLKRPERRSSVQFESEKRAA